jgi:hypothetical protein
LQQQPRPPQHEKKIWLFDSLLSLTLLSLTALELPPTSNANPESGGRKKNETKQFQKHKNQTVALLNSTERGVTIVGLNNLGFGRKTKNEKKKMSFLFLLTFAGEGAATPVSLSTYQRVNLQIYLILLSHLISSHPISHLI